MRNCRHQLHAVCLVAVACLPLWFSTVMAAQVTQASPASPPNWRDIPVRPHAHPDSANPAERHARNDYWTKRFPTPGSSSYIPQGALYDPRQPEIRDVPGSFWAIGTFVGYDVYEVPNDGAYTEIHFRLDQIIGPKANNTPQAGTTVDVALRGGTVLTPSGEVRKVSSGVLRSSDAPQPRGSYLLQLVLQPDEGFYLPVDYWEITDGKVFAVTPLNRAIVRHGHSHIEGLSVADAVTYLQNALSAH